MNEIFVGHNNPSNRLTCQRQSLHTPHPADMLKAKVSKLGAPPQEQRVESQHGGNVPDSNVSHVDTPRTEIQ